MREFTLVMSIPAIQTYLAQFAEGEGVLEGGQRVRGHFQRIGYEGNPLVSIVTIVRNGEATLERTINGVLTQSYTPIEYIVIDGGSTDQTLSIIARYDNELAYWRSEPDKGISDAFNKGIALASGDIIGMINADDWYELNAVADAVHSLLTHNADVVHGALQYWDGNRKGVFMEGNHDRLQKYMSLSHPTVFAKRDLYLHHGLFRLDYRYAMDYEWLLRVKTAGAVFFYLDKSLANMQLGGASDYNWRLGFQESAQAKTTHLGYSYQHTFFYIFLLLKGGIRRLTEKHGLYLITRIYREYFGQTKKR
jgi:glycosyltransferase involved in cell wall biosynthesis